MQSPREGFTFIQQRAGETGIRSLLTQKQSNEIEAIFEKCFSGTLGLKVKEESRLTLGL